MKTNASRTIVCGGLVLASLVARTARAEEAGLPAGTVRLHVDASGASATVERRASPAESWQRVCEAPCDQPVAVDGEYRITGATLRPSTAFRLDPARAEAKSVVLHLSATPAKKRDFWIGAALAGGGAALLVDGVLALALASTSGAFPEDGTTSSSYSTQMYVGMTLTLAGVSAGIGGASLLMSNTSTAVGGGVAAPPSTRGFMLPIVSGHF